MLPLIVGLEGLKLTKKEQAFIERERPAGFILFQRNCESKAQVKALTQSLRDYSQHAPVMILIDQEGGRVARMKPPTWRHTPAAAALAGDAEQNLETSKRRVYLNARLIAAMLLECGVNVNCAPLADIPSEECNAIIGDRAYGVTAEQVSALADAMAKGLLEGGVLPVLKHIPGHGRATVDSHLDLPEVRATLNELTTSDFKPFQYLQRLPLGMTAHIRYHAIDPELPATLSPEAIRLIRETIGFKGVLMSDDISMKALQGEIGDVASQARKAGCDLVLHCNGNMREMQAIADKLSPCDAVLEQKLRDVWKHLPAADEADVTAMEKEFAALCPEPALA